VTGPKGYGSEPLDVRLKNPNFYNAVLGPHASDVNAWRRMVSGFFVTLHRLCINGFLERDVVFSSIGPSGVGLYVDFVDMLDRMHAPGGDTSTADFCRVWLRSQTNSAEQSAALSKL
jgi:hypothetical protein